MALEKTMEMHHQPHEIADFEQNLIQWGFARIYDARDGGAHAAHVRAQAREASYAGLVLLKLPFGESAVLFRGRDVSLRRLASLFGWNTPRSDLPPRAPASATLH
jgi:hypothetical protein